MLKSFLNHSSSLLRAWRRPQLTLGIAILMLACGLTAACSSGASSNGPSTSTGLPSVTSGNSSTSTSSGTATNSTPSPGGPLACTQLSPLLPVLQAGKLHVTFEMAVGTSMAMKGSVTSFHDAGGLTMNGQGYLVSPNDPILVQIVQGASSVQITVKDTSTGQVTTYTATSCSTKTASDIELSGTDPASFTLDMLVTP